MIVRNEERHLAACLQSIRPLVDEIIIVDTGSTDGSIRIARRFGARVFHMKWPGNFAAARNRSLAHATGDWILFIDADERLRPPLPVAALRRRLRDRRIVAMTVDLHATPRSTALRTVRLFRRDPRVRFEGAMHESMMRGVTRVIHEDGGVQRHSGLAIDHVGYEDSALRKARRNLPLLTRALNADPGNIWNRAHLGIVYVTLGRPRAAVAAWRRGIRDVSRSGATQLMHSAAHSAYAGWLVSNGKPAGAVIADGLRRFPGNLELQWIRARWLMTRRRWRQAIAAIEAILHHRGGRRLDRQLPYPEGIFGADAFEALGTCHFQLRDYARAARWYARAHRAAPEKAEFRVKSELARALARKRTLAS